MEKIGYRGILDIGYRYDQRDGEYKVLDVNPRIGATFRLFVGQNGIDVARALYLDLTSQPVPSTSAREGRKWMVELDFKSCLDYHRDGNLTVAQWLKSLRGIEEFGYLRRDDLRPVLALGRIALKRIAGNFVSGWKKAIAAGQARRRAKAMLDAAAAPTD
jgi:predicted ATP-grasp superfamily ATP-dependent carboligase